MKICVVLIVNLLALNAFAFSGDDSFSTHEMAPLYDHEIRRSNVFGAEIGSGAVVGADSIFCSDASDYQQCYASIQRVLVRTQRAAEKLAATNDFIKAREKLFDGLRISTANIGANFSNAGGILLKFLSRGIELNAAFSGTCHGPANTAACLNEEAKGAYDFLNTYVEFLLNNVYRLDVDFFLPLTADDCGQDVDSVAFVKYLDRYLDMQRNLLRIAAGEEPYKVNFLNAYFEARVTVGIFEYVVEDMQGNFPLSAFYSGISVTKLLAIADDLQVRIKSTVTQSSIYSDVLKDAKVEAYSFISRTSNYVFYSADLPKVNCSIEK